jgi:hypothetical protein
MGQSSVNGQLHTLAVSAAAWFLSASVADVASEAAFSYVISSTNDNGLYNKEDEEDEEPSEEGTVSCLVDALCLLIASISYCLRTWSESSKVH